MNPTFASSVFAEPPAPTASSSSRAGNRNFVSTVFASASSDDNYRGKKCFGAPESHVFEKVDESTTAKTSNADLLTSDGRVELCHRRRHFPDQKYRGSINRLSADAPDQVRLKAHPHLQSSTMADLLQDPPVRPSGGPNGDKFRHIPAVRGVADLGSQQDPVAHNGKMHFPHNQTAFSESKPLIKHPTDVPPTRLSAALSTSDSPDDRPSGRKHVPPVEHLEPDNHLIIYSNGQTIGDRFGHLPSRVPKRQTRQYQPGSPLKSSVEKQIMTRYERKQQEMGEEMGGGAEVILPSNYGEPVVPMEAA